MVNNLRTWFYFLFDSRRQSNQIDHSSLTFRMVKRGKEFNLFFFPKLGANND